MAIYGVMKKDSTDPINIMTDQVKHWFLISLEIRALSYSSCSFLGKELKPETYLAALSLKAANKMPTNANGMDKIMHDQKPILFILYPPKGYLCYIYNKDKWYFCKVVNPYFLSRTVKVKDGMKG